MGDCDRAADLKRLAHDVRNALNGVAVNLEVARSRVKRGVDVAQVTPFLDTAAQQLETAAQLHKHYSAIAIAVATDPRSTHTTHVTDPALDDTHLPS